MHVLRYILFFVGFAAVVFGVGLIYVPLGFIVAGATMIFLALVIDKMLHAEERQAS